jgi:hypothetical protein
MHVTSLVKSLFNHHIAKAYENEAQQTNKAAKEGARISGHIEAHRHDIEHEYITTSDQSLQQKSEPPA